jgi:acetyl-CoA C-acetyltransferase
MSATPVLISAWARSAVVPVDGAFRALHAHDIAAPIVQALLQRAGVPASAVDAMVMGNALGAGGNPARMAALAAGLPDHCPAFTIDSQCCSGLDAVGTAANMIASGQAHVVIAGGAEAWSRAPIRHHRPMHAYESAVAYERPAFAPDPTRDPDLLQAAALYAQQHQYSRAQQNTYAQQSHARALQHQPALQSHVVPIATVTHDAYPRDMADHKLHRIPLAASIENKSSDVDCGVSQLAVSVKADGAAFVLLMSQSACQQLGCEPQAQWMAHASVGCAPDMPLLAAQVAAQALLKRAAWPTARTLQAVELHDAFAVQGMSFNKALSLSPDICNTYGGGLARGHPIGASGAVALVQLLTRLSLSTHSQPTGLVAIAAAGGLGSAALVYSLKDDAAFTC